VLLYPRSASDAVVEAIVKEEGISWIPEALAHVIRRECARARAVTGFARPAVSPERLLPKESFPFIPFALRRRAFLARRLVGVSTALRAPDNNVSHCYRHQHRRRYYRPDYECRQELRSRVACHLAFSIGSVATDFFSRLLLGVDGR